MRTLLLSIHWRPLAAIVLVAGLASCAALYMVSWGVARFLVVSDPVQTADAILLLNGELNIRPFQARELLKQGVAPRILIARMPDRLNADGSVYFNPSDHTAYVLEMLGVPPEQVTVVPAGSGVTSTYDEAAVLSEYVREQGLQTVVLVTSAYHTRRAQWIFAHMLEDAPVTLLTSPAFGHHLPSTWWRSRWGLEHLFWEAVKYPYYLLRYR